MNHIVRFCLMLTILLSAATLNAQPARTPLQFSNQLSDITDSLYSYGQAWGTQYKIIVESRSREPYAASKAFSTLKPYRQAMAAFVDRTINRLTAMKDVSGSRDLRMAMIHFMEYEKKMVDVAFTPIEQLKATVTDAELNTVLDKLRSYSAAEGAELKKVAAAQEAYAEANGFSIESAEDAKKP